MNHNGFTPEQWIERKTAIDVLEPEFNPSDLIRQAQRKTIELLNAVGNALERALARPDANVRDIAIAWWGPAYALGLNCCEGMTMTQRSERLGFERATLSKAATAFCLANDLEPSFYMKRADAADMYRDARLRAVERSCKPHQRAKPFKPMPELPP